MLENVVPLLLAVTSSASVALTERFYINAVGVVFNVACVTGNVGSLPLRVLGSEGPADLFLDAAARLLRDCLLAVGSPHFFCG